MTYYNPNPDTIREEIYSVAKNDQSEGLFLTDYYGSTLDGSDVAAYMESIGFDVISFEDTGGCGLVTLSCGVQISTNGACMRRKSKWTVEISRNGSLMPDKYEVTARTRQQAKSEALEKHFNKFSFMDDNKIVGAYQGTQYAD